MALILLRLKKCVNRIFRFTLPSVTEFNSIHVSGFMPELNILKEYGMA